MGRFAAVVVLAHVVACSSEAERPPCTIAGTFQETVKITGGDCPAGGGDPITVTVTQRPAGVTGGPDYKIAVPGITGDGCGVSLVEQCKVQGKCEILIADATGPMQYGTVQYSWAFTDTGFTGLSTVSIPPSVSLDGGCTGSADVSGVRR